MCPLPAQSRVFTCEFYPDRHNALISEEEILKTKFTLLIAAVILVAVAPAQAQLTYTSTPALAIPDNDPVTGITDMIVVPDNGIITDLNVQITVTHTWVGDLIFTLEHVNTTNAQILIDRMGVPATGAGCADDDLDVWIDDEGLDGDIEDTCLTGPPAAFGDYVGGDPADPTLLANYDGEDIIGDWTMTVTDNAGGDIGTLEAWTIEEPVIPVELQAFTIE